MTRRRARSRAARGGGSRRLTQRSSSTHLAAADAAGKPGHGLARVPWLEGLLDGELDPRGTPERLERGEGFERWHGRGALGYLTLAAVCDGAGRRPARARAARRLRVVLPDRGARRAGRDGSPRRGSWRVVTATSPQRLPHPAGGPPLTGTNPIAIAVPRPDGRPLVADVSMGAVTHGDVLAGTRAAGGARAVRRGARAQGVRAGRRRRAARRRARRARARRGRPRRAARSTTPCRRFRELAAGSGCRATASL